MVLWLFGFSVLLLFGIVPFTSSYTPRCYRPGVLCPVYPPVAYHTPQPLQAPRGSAECRSFYRYWTAMAADVADNGETGGKRNAGSQPCPLHQVLCFIDGAWVCKGFKAGFRPDGRDDVYG